MRVRLPYSEYGMAYYYDQLLHRAFQLMIVIVEVTACPLYRMHVLRAERGGTVFSIGVEDTDDWLSLSR